MLPVSPELRPSALRQTVTRSGTRIYTLEVAAYRSLMVNVFVVCRGSVRSPDYLALVDVGSERPACFAEILAGLQAIRELYGEPISLEVLDRVVLTHEHPDHIGGLALLQAQWTAASPIPLAAHAQAAESVADPHAAQQRSLQALEALATWVGLPANVQTSWLAGAQRPLLPEGFAVETILHGGEQLDGLFDVVPLPGHAAGQIGLQIDDFLLSADHLLVGNLPPLYPKRLRPRLGLHHYLGSLRRIEAPDIVTVLPSHGDPIVRPNQCAQQARQKIRTKLGRVLHGTREYPAQTLTQLNQRLYSGQPPQRERLLLSQTAALAEYLEQCGYLTAEVTPEGAARWTVTAAGQEDLHALNLEL